MRVLIACEFSGTVREAFAALGHDAWSCDILPTERPGKHIRGDVLRVLDMGWDLMIAHPPCRYLTFAGVRHWNAPGREQLREESAEFFMRLVNAPIPKIAVENPVGEMNRRYRKPDQIIHPWMFGDSAYKKTCLWLKRLPPLFWSKDPMFNTTAPLPEPVSIDPPDARNPNKKRWFTDGSTRDPHERSRTFQGIARAMADQWGRMEVRAW